MFAWYLDPWNTTKEPSNVMKQLLGWWHCMIVRTYLKGTSWYIERALSWITTPHQKQTWLLNGYFFQPFILLSRYKNTQLVQDGYQIQSEAVASVLVTCVAHMNILFIFKVNVLVLIIYVPPPPNYVGCGVENGQHIFSLLDNLARMSYCLLRFLCTGG